jgi:hypothetical protein
MKRPLVDSGVAISTFITARPHSNAPGGPAAAGIRSLV